MVETVMGLLYAIFSIFITLFFPKQRDYEEKSVNNNLL